MNRAIAQQALFGNYDSNMSSRLRNPALALYLMQRFSGIVLAALLIVHFVTIGYAVQGDLTVAEITNRVRGNLIWTVFYGVFIAAALIHVAIGLRNIFIEMLKVNKRIIEAAIALYCAGGLFLGYETLRAIW